MLSFRLHPNQIYDNPLNVMISLVSICQFPLLKQDIQDQYYRMDKKLYLYVFHFPLFIIYLYTNSTGFEEIAKPFKEISYYHFTNLLLTFLSTQSLHINPPNTNRSITTICLFVFNLLHFLHVNTMTGLHIIININVVIVMFKTININIVMIIK